MEKNDTIYAKWLSGELNEQEIESLRNSGELEELEALINATEHLVLTKFDHSGNFEKLRSKLSKAEKTTTVIRNINYGRIISIAAMFTLLIGVALWWMEQSTTIESNYTSTKFTSLSDNTDVILNDGSKIEFDERDWDKQRNISLTGEAYFKVTKGNPFKVKTKNGTISVLGTSFNIRSWGDNLYVECYTGKVKVKGNNGEETILTKQRSINFVAGKMQNEKIFDHKAPLWTLLTSRFHDEKLNDVFSELERQFDVRVKIGNNNRRFSGSFSHQNLEAALDQICKPMALKYKIGNNKNIIITDQ